MLPLPQLEISMSRYLKSVLLGNVAAIGIFFFSILQFGICRAATCSAICTSAELHSHGAKHVLEQMLC